MGPLPGSLSWDPLVEFFQNSMGPLVSVGQSHTSFSTGEFRAAQRTLGSDVLFLRKDKDKNEYDDESWQAFIFSGF